VNLGGFNCVLELTNHLLSRRVQFESQTHFVPKVPGTPYSLFHSLRRYLSHNPPEDSTIVSGLRTTLRALCIALNESP